MKFGAAYYNRGRTMYAVVLDQEGAYWNGSAFVAADAGDWAQYALALAESIGSGIYLGDVPGALEDTVGQYMVVVFEQVGGTPDVAADMPVASGGLADLVAQASAAATAQVASLAAAVSSLEAAVPTAAAIRAEILGYAVDEGVDVLEALKRMNTVLAAKLQKVVNLNPLTVEFYEEDGITVHFTVVYPNSRAVDQVVQRI